MSWIGGLIAMPFLLAWWVIAHLWPLLLVAAVVFVGLKARKAWMGLAASTSTQVTRSATSSAKPAVINYEISKRAEFTQALAELQSAVTGRAQRDALARVAELDAILGQYKAAGQLSPALERELWTFIERNAGALAGFSDDISQALNRLIRLYAPRRGLTYWWQTKVLS